MNFQHPPPMQHYYYAPHPPEFYPHYPDHQGHPSNFAYYVAPPNQVNYPPAPLDFPPVPGYSPFVRNGSGWYFPPGSHSAGNARHSPIADAPTSLPSEKTDDPSVCAYWRGRIAPLPGFCSPHDMFTSRPSTSKAVQIRSSPSNTHTSPSAESSQSASQSLTFSSVPSVEENEKSTFQLDKYADIFIPQYLKDIQNQTQTFKPLNPSSVFPSPLYYTSFLPSSLIEKHVHLYPSTILASPSPEMVSCPPLNIDNYYKHWNALLSWELDQMASDKQNIVLWRMSVSARNWDSAEFAVHVPGIRENHPRLDIGDIVHLREVLVDWKVGSGIAFEGRVTTLKKREGFIQFHCPSLKLHIQTYIPPAPGQEIHEGLPVFKADDKIPPVFNLSFLTNPQPSVLMDVAAATVGDALASQNKGNFTRRWLFPEPDDLLTDSPIPATPPNMSGEHWVDNGLNAEQRVAAISIAMYQSPVPYLINGPPGTGKTRTIVECVHQILRTQPEAHVLLCAPSNSATDTLALRLGTTLQPGDMLRLNDENRTFAEVPDPVRQFCYIESDKFALPPWPLLMRYRVVVTSCLDASILVNALCTNPIMCELEEQTMSSIHPHRRIKHQVVPHWTHLLIDEAAQGSEPELLIPISVVLTRPTAENEFQDSFNYHPLSITPQLVLCGDPNQLGPIITSDKARSNELDISLLERLFERPIYTDHPVETRSPLSPIGYRNRRHSSLSIDGHANPGSVLKPFANLLKNYRSHPAILMPPSAMFYNDSLEPFATNGMLAWSGLPNPKFPLMFMARETPEESNDERATWFNPGEINCVVEVVMSLLAEATRCLPVLKAEDIGVMAPWREQVWKLRAALRQVSLGRVDVGTVEDYQGREKRVVIISCVRSSARFLKEDAAKGIGLVFEKKRMNVAITRAKELLIIVGNGSLLKRDPYWKGFLQFVMRNNLYVGPDLQIEMDGAWISRLETEIVEAQEETGFLEPDVTRERSTMLLAGGVAREVLREDY